MRGSNVDFLFFPKATVRRLFSSIWYIYTHDGTYVGFLWARWSYLYLPSFFISSHQRHSGPQFPFPRAYQWPHPSNVYSLFHSCTSHNPSVSTVWRMWINLFRGHFFILIFCSKHRSPSTVSIGPHSGSSSSRTSARVLHFDFWLRRWVHSTSESQNFGIALSQLKNKCYHDQLIVAIHTLRFFSPSSQVATVTFCCGCNSTYSFFPFAV